MTRTRKPYKPRQNAPGGQQVALVAQGAQCVDCGRMMPLAVLWIDPFNGTPHCQEIPDCWRREHPEEKKETN